MVSDLSFGSVSRSSLLHRLTRPTSAPFRVRALTPVSGRLCGATGEGPITPPRFPAAFQPPAFASWAVLRPLGISPSSRSAYRTGNRRPDPNGVITFHLYETRPGRMPTQPRERRCSHDRTDASGRRLPLRNGQFLHLDTTTHHPRLTLTRPHQGFTCVHPSVFSSPVVPGWIGHPWA